MVTATQIAPCIRSEADYHERLVEDCQRDRKKNGFAVEGCLVLCMRCGKWLPLGEQ